MIKHRHIRYVRVTWCALSALLWSMNVFAEPVKCANENVTVYAEKQRDIAHACLAIDKTYVFLRSSGFNKPVPAIYLHIVSKLPEHPYFEECFGYHNRRTRQTYLLSYEACKGWYFENSFLGLTFNRELHNSFIVHEIAHAIAGAHFVIKTQGVAAQEYIAYTAQIALMSESLRKDLLTRIQNEAFEDYHEITSTFHDLSPLIFAVKAYRHFRRKENGTIFYQKLLCGEVILDGEEQR